ncbi:hypothetical protein ACTJJ7_23135 [Phyllobacterium sp. 22229]|uniref:1,4-alpha-glucan branching enzyme n=1 Tax=Phyllobacterium myrsinacearum TaxID=28101 RepID=A0A2S9JAH0_9HYPH|nr:hypothetical protein [Phyllobacterium myrsinacearum]PRD49788.1 hypothetical protein C5750_24855 [Phyllobacterium myrsinacearum]PWV94763.1 hypothetical protein DEV92_102216 [Phyllobacterium myrsinacearum]RZS87834.1 hypothetical protein EV217_0210 [Phyllobacterium myrsinacearum]RZV07128.1 hypothetical protein EV654_1797 [Phyllobacterium myrsinacearum]
MSESITLTDHQAIRDWVSARAGSPAIIDTAPEPEGTPVLRIVFEPEFVADVDQPLDAGGLEVVEWDDWFRLFDAQNMVFLIAKDEPGKLDMYHQILKA